MSGVALRGVAPFVVLAVLACLAACGGTAQATPAPKITSPTTIRPDAADRTAILRAFEKAFVDTTHAPADVALSPGATGLVEVLMPGGAAWARATFEPTAAAPMQTGAGLEGGHDEGFFSQAPRRAWTWRGYVGAYADGCEAAPAVPTDVAAALGVHRTPCSTPSAGSAPAAAPTPSSPASGAAPTTLNPGDLATLLSLYVTARNGGSSGQVLTPSSIITSPTSPPQAALVPGGAEWAVVTYVPAAGAPEPLTAGELEDGAGTAIFYDGPQTGWVLRGLAGSSFCGGAAALKVPAAVLAVWGHTC